MESFALSNGTRRWNVCASSVVDTSISFRFDIDSGKKLVFLYTGKLLSFKSLPSLQMILVRRMMNHLSQVKSEKFLGTNMSLT